MLKARLLATLLGLSLGIVSVRAEPPAPGAAAGRPAAAPVSPPVVAPNSGSGRFLPPPTTALRPPPAAPAAAPAVPAAPTLNPDTAPSGVAQDWQRQDQQQLQQLDQLQLQAQQQMLQQLGLSAASPGLGGDAAVKIQHYLAVVMDPKFIAAVTAVREHPNRMLMAYCEAGWLLMLILFRSWRASHIDHWLKRLWMRLWTGAVFIVGSSIVLPGLIFGAPYIEAVRLLVNGVAGTKF